MTVSAGDQATLYPHEPTSLLALLSQHLPYSSSVFGTIKTNSWPNFTIPKDLFLPDGIDGLDQEQIASVVWTTFPPEEVDDPPEIWAVIIHLPQPQRRQTRLYCSAQRTLHGTSSSSPTDPETSTTAAREVDNEEGVRREGQSVVDGMIKTFLACSPVVELLGGVSTLWTEEIWEYLGTERRPIYDSWLAPVLPITRTEDDWESRVNKDGLVVDKARKEDCPIIAETRDIKEGLAYYHAQLDQITVIRSTEGEAVAWVMTHSAGDLGALYTLPAYRRRGLARWVVEERLKEIEKQGLRGIIWTGQDNVKSQGLWKSMGWSRGWSAQWMPVR